MTPRQSISYTYRPETNSHKDELTNYITADGREFVHLGERVFHTLPAVYNGPKFSGELDEEMKWIAATFYRGNNRYRVPRLKKGYDGKESFAPETLLTCNVEEATTGHRRNISFVLGDVGVGKSTLINYLISVPLAQMESEARVWFCRIDIERKSDMTHLAKPELSMYTQLVNIAEKVGWIAENYILPKLGETDAQTFRHLRAALNATCQTKTDAPPPLPKDIAHGIRQIIEFVHRTTKRQFVLILDNIDYIGHVNDRLKFAGDLEELETKTLNAAINLIRLVHSGQLFGDAACTAIVALRHETYDTIDNYQGTSFTKAFPDSTFFSVDTVDAELAVKLRCDLLREAAQRRAARVNKPTQAEHVSAWVDTIETYLGFNQPRGRGNRLIDELNAVSNHGLRSILEHVGKYTVAPFFSTALRLGDESNDTEVHHNIHRARILFMLGRRLRFSQAKSHFPNLYLAVKLHQRDPKGAVVHCHSYWVKRLLFEYLHQRKCPTVEQILSLFCVEDDGYEPYIIRELLGSLYEANSSAVISARRAYAGDGGMLSITHVEMLARGNHIKANLLDTFAYLQLVVDDYMLPIPNFLSDDLSFEGRQDYRYLMTTADPKAGSTASMLRQKVDQVIALIDLLATSLEIEQEFRPKTFQRLVEDGGIELPNMEAVRKKIFWEISAIGGKLHGGSLHLDALAEQRKNERLQTLRQFFRRSMREGFIDIAHTKAAHPELFRIEYQAAD